MNRRRRGRTAKVIGCAAGALLVAAAAGAGCSGSVTDSGGLLVVMKTDGTLPQADKLHVEVSSQSGAVYSDLDHKIPSEITLPATLGIVSDGSATGSVVINVSLYAGATLLDDRINQVLEVPTDRVAELDIVFSSKCTALAVLSSTGPASTCTNEGTCDPSSGQCVTSVVHGDTLPTYGGDVDASVIPGEGGIVALGDASGAADAGVDATRMCSGSACDVVDGSSGLGAGDATTDAAGDAGFDASTITFMEDFETYEAGIIPDGGTLGELVASNSSQGYLSIKDFSKDGGSRVLAIASNSDMIGGGQLTKSPTGPAFLPGGKMFGRMLIYYDLPTGTSLAQTSQLFQGIGNIDGGVAASMTISNLRTGGTSTAWQLTTEPVGGSVSDGTVVPQQWHCLQWEFDGTPSAPNDVATLVVDDAGFFANLAQFQGWQLPSMWTSFSIGYFPNAHVYGQSVYIDDFAIGTAPIPCPPTPPFPSAPVSNDGL